MYRIPRKPQVTTASGSPPENFLTQSPRGAFSIGTLQKMGNLLWGYSGMVNFDGLASASYPLLQFTLEKDALIKAQFDVDWKVLAGNTDIGFNVSIDGVSSINTTIEKGERTMGPWIVEFFVPAGRDCNMVVLNPDASAALLQANVTVVGHYV
jgi:hypothetical protein